MRPTQTYSINKASRLINKIILCICTDKLLTLSTVQAFFLRNALYKLAIITIIIICSLSYTSHFTVNSTVKALNCHMLQSKYMTQKSTKSYHLMWRPLLQ